MPGPKLWWERVPLRSPGDDLDAISMHMTDI